MAVQMKNSVFAVTTETTEGTPVAPSAATEFLAFHEGFSFTPEFAVLSNSEMKASIARSKDILGMESPSASFSHYMRSSGVEGTEASFAPLLKASLGASSTTNTEYNTVASSTTTVVKVDSGEGASFERGEALMIKNENGDAYEIRNIASISSDDLTLAQSLNNAPGTGVELGKAQLYKGVTDSTHPSLSLWAYISNGAAIEVISGARVSDMTINGTAGEFISTDFTFTGSEFFYGPLEVTASNEKLDFDIGGSELTATLPIRWYKDPYELASALTDAMNAVSSDVITVSYSDSDKKFTIATAGATLNLLWNTGSNTASTVGALLGFSVAADDTSATTYTADNALTLSASYTPNYDEADPLVAKNNQVMIGTSTEVTCFDAKSVTFNLANSVADLPSLCAESGKLGTLVMQRDVSIEVSGYLTSGQAEEFKRYRNNDEILFTWNFGEKTAGNWVAGKTVNVHCPTVRISSFSLVDDGGIVALNMTLQAFTDEGEAEVFINTL